MIAEYATTYNGIPQPGEWPPSLDYDGSRRPMPVPYLESPPNVVPIDVGRQLFVDDFLIESTTLRRRFHQPQKSEHNLVLWPETEAEMDGGECPTAAPFNDGVWYDPADRLFKMWYHASWMRNTAYAVSEDGIEWRKPELDVVPGTNIVLAPRPGFRRDGCCVWLDHEASDPDQRFKMFQYFRSSGEFGKPWQGGEVYTSADGIYWGEPTRTGLLGDNSTFFYNPFRQKWVYSIRTASLPRKIAGVRTRSYREHSDFLEGSQWEDDEPVIWAWSDEFDEPDPQIGEVPQLYDLNAVAYESIMLGLIAIFFGPPNPVAAEQGVPKTIDLELGFSRDGFHWDRPNRRPFIPATRTPSTWGRGYIHAAGGTCLVVGDKLYFYYGAWSGESPRLSGSMMGGHQAANAMYAGGDTGLATLRRDGFASIDAGQDGGLLTTKLVTFDGRHLFVNADTISGELRVEVLDRHGTVVAPYSADNCVPMSIDGTRQMVMWEGSDDLSTLRSTPLRFRFHLTNGSLYSFWMSHERSGASNGFVAAGGPGLKGDMDMVPST
jgi:hypothetical protein